MKSQQVLRKKHKRASQLIDAESPNATSKSGSVVVLKNSITENDEKVNSKAKSLHVGDVATPIVAPCDKKASDKGTDKRIDVFERPKPNEGYAPKNDASKCAFIVQYGANRQ